jgi:hypothetical protein
VDKLRYMNIGLEKNLWVFLKNQSAIEEVPMRQVITNLIEAYRKKLEKKVDKN